MILPRRSFHPLFSTFHRGYLRKVPQCSHPLIFKHYSSTNETKTEPPKIQLRPYQEDCIQSCLNEIETGARRIAVSLPTGGGKTVIFSNLIERVKAQEGYGDATLILVHRKELALQAAAMCRKVYPDRKIEIEMQTLQGDWRSKPDIVIASIQTLIRRLDNYYPEDFKLVITDECHHAAANSYLKVFEHFNIKDEKSDVASIGFSATVRREDEKSLHKVYDKIVFHMNLEDMINDKHLSDAKFTTVRMENADLGKVKSRLGDFVISGLSNEINKPQNNETVLRTYLHFREQYNLKSALLFGVDIAHVASLNELFNSRGVTSRCVTSKSKKQDRDEYIKQFKMGQVSVLMNCGIFTEGTDIPNIDCILMVRPTKSETLLVQMIGRGLRLHKGKEICHIIDFVGINNSSVISVPVLKNLPPDFHINGMTLTEIEDMKQQIDETERVAKEAKEREEVLKQQIIDNVLSSNLVADIEARELELTTYESLREFVETKDGRKSDFDYIFDEFDYPWIAGPTNYVWIMPTHDISRRNNHLRLEIHPKGLSKRFLDDDVDISNIYTDALKLKKTADLDTKLYTLTLYEEREAFLNKRNFYQKRFNASLVAPFATDIRVLLKAANQVMSQLTKNSYVDTTKSAKWRLKQATPKQMEFLTNLIKKALKGQYSTKFIDEFNKKILEDTEKFNAGKVSEALAVFGIFRNQGLKKLIERLIKTYKLTEIADAERLNG